MNHISRCCFLLLFSLLIVACTSGEEEKAVENTRIDSHTNPKEKNPEKPTAENSKKFQLTNETISILLPLGFKHSDRPHIKEDIPAMKTDPLLMVPLQGGIDDLRSEDDFPDLFVDTLSDYRFVLVHNFQYLELDKEVQDAIEKYLHKRMDFLETLVRFIKVQRQSIDYTETENHNRFKVRYLVTDKENPNHKIWLTMYFIATANQSYYIFMASATEDDLEAYLTAIEE